MPDQGVDIHDLERRVSQLEKALERIGDRATRREDEWGSVRAQAGRVDGLRDEVRALRHLVNRLVGLPPEQMTAPAPLLAPAATEQSSQPIVDAVLQQLKGQAIPTTKADAAALVRQAILQDEAVRQAIVSWLIKELAERGFSLPADQQRRVSAKPRR